MSTSGTEPDRFRSVARGSPSRADRAGAVSGLVDGAVGVFLLPGIWIAVVAVVPPVTVGVILREFWSAHRREGLGWLLAYWILLVVAVLAGDLAARRFTVIAPAVDAALGRTFSRYDNRYRTWVLNKHRHVRNDLPSAGWATPEIDDVFVDVSLMRRPTQEISSGLAIDAPLRLAERSSIWTFLDNRKPANLALLGAPGSGKTTLVRHVARAVASRSRLPGNRTIPVLIELRDVAESIVGADPPDLPTLAAEIARRIPGGVPPQWWERRLARGKCVVMFDGLDEVVVPEHRAAVVRWIDEQHTSYGRNHMVVTSRPRAYDRYRTDGALTLQVRTLTDEQISHFLNRWYGFVLRGEASGDHGGGWRSGARAEAQDLVHRLAETSALRDLMTNPLLLTMIANVHHLRRRSNRTGLPESRAELYEEILRVVLRPKDHTDPEAADRTAIAKQVALQGAAIAMMRASATDLSEDDLCRVIGDHHPGFTAREILDDSVSNGIVIRRAPGMCAFAHLTFQEYLAACFLRVRGGSDELKRHVGDAWWRETILLWATGNRVDPIVAACLDEGTAAALPLAFECGEIGTVSSDLSDRLHNVLATAYERNSDSAHVRLVGGVEAIRHLRRYTVTSSGTRVCVAPVGTNLYWLYLKDRTAARPPDVPCEPTADGAEPARGMWGADALDFVAWVNEVIRQNEGQDTTVRLATHDELSELAGAGGPTGAMLRTSVTHVWAGAGSPGGLAGLWSAPDQPSPHMVTVDQLHQALDRDMRRLGRRYLLTVGLHLQVAMAAQQLTGLYESSKKLFGLYLGTAESLVAHTKDRLRAAEEAMRATWSDTRLEDRRQNLRFAQQAHEVAVRAQRRAALASTDLESSLHRTGGQARTTAASGQEADLLTARDIRNDVNKTRREVETLLAELERTKPGEKWIYNNIGSLSTAHQKIWDVSRRCDILQRNLAAARRQVHASTYREAQTARKGLREASAMAPVLHQHVHELESAMGDLQRAWLKQAMVSMTVDGPHAPGGRADDPFQDMTRHLGKGFTATLKQILNPAQPEAGPADVLLEESWSVDLVVGMDSLSGALARLAETADTGPEWRRRIVRRLITLAGPPFGRSRPITGAAEHIRLCALALASEPGEVLAQDCRLIAAGTVLLEDRAAGRRITERLVLAHV